MLHVPPADDRYVGRSRVPVPETQQIAPYKVKGITVYITKQEAERPISRHGYLASVFGLWGFVILCLMIAGPYDKNSK